MPANKLKEMADAIATEVELSKATDRKAVYAIVINHLTRMVIDKAVGAASKNVGVVLSDDEIGLLRDLTNPEP